MTTIEVYSDIDTLSDKIYELRADGVTDDNMTVVAKDRLDANVLRYTRVPFRKATGTMWDKVAAKFLDEDSKQRVAEQLNLTGGENAEYRRALDDGQIILLIRSKEDEADALQESEGSLETQDQTSEASGSHTEVAVKATTPTPKKKHANYMARAEIIHEDGNQRIVSTGNHKFTIVNMKHELTEEDKQEEDK